MSNKSKNKKILKTATSIITFVVLLFTLKDQIVDLFIDIIVDTPTTFIRGTVIDSTDLPIFGAIVTLDILPEDTVYTTSNGNFFIDNIPGKNGDQIRINISSKKFSPHNEYITLPGPVKIKLNQK